MSRTHRLGQKSGGVSLGKALSGTFTDSRSMEDSEYPKLAAVEDRMWYFRALHAQVAHALRQALPPSRPAELLDAGCGTGGLIRRLAPQSSHWRWSGLDLSPVACALARNRVAPEVKIVEGSVTALPMADASCDAVTSLDVIYHVDDDRAALREFFRVLRPGGAVVINAPAFPWLWSYHDVATHARRRYRRRELIEKLQAAGFTEVRTTYWNTLLFPLVVFRRRFWPAPRGGSDVALSPAPVEWGLNAAMVIERAWLRTFGYLPFGSSVFVTARKPVS
jgi:SAM-dependent methyltransferase